VETGDSDSVNLGSNPGPPTTNHAYPVTAYTHYM